MENNNSVILSYYFRGNTYTYDIDFKPNYYIKDDINNQTMISQDDYTYIIHKDDTSDCNLLQLNCLKCNNYFKSVKCKDSLCLSNCLIFNIEDLRYEFNNNKKLRLIVKVTKGIYNIPCDILYDIISDSESNMTYYYEDKYIYSNHTLYYENDKNIILKNVKYVIPYIHDAEIFIITTDNKFYKFKDGCKVNEIIIDTIILGFDYNHIIYLNKFDQLINLDLFECDTEKIYKNHVSEDIKGEILIIQPYCYFHELRCVFIFTTEKYLYCIKEDKISHLKYEKDIINITPYIFEQKYDDFSEYLILTHIDSTFEMIHIRNHMNPFNECDRKIFKFNYQLIKVNDQSIFNLNVYNIFDSYKYFHNDTKSSILTLLLILKRLNFKLSKIPKIILGYIILFLIN